MKADDIRSHQCGMIGDDVSAAGRRSVAALAFSCPIADRDWRQLE